jgi:hypothetical protein
MDDFEYDFEPVSGCLVEMIPPSTGRQGVGISADVNLDMIELDVYFFPCDFSEDEKRDLPLMYVRQSVISTKDAKMVEEFVRKYFPLMDKTKKTAVIPFSFDRVAELEGNFIDDYKTTEKICRAAVKGGNKYELKNCDLFLDFIKDVGLK